MKPYDFTPDDGLPEPHATMVRMGMELGVMSLKSGENEQIVQAAAVFHAKFQAESGRMGHQNWDRRSKKLFEQLPGFTNFREVAAGSWRGELSPEEGGRSIFAAWKASPDHWPWVNGRCSIWGYGMAFNKEQKLWYGTGIFADRR